MQEQFITAHVKGHHLSLVERGAIAVLQTKTSLIGKLPACWVSVTKQLLMS